MQEPDKARTRRRLVRRPSTPQPPPSVRIRPSEWQAQSSADRPYNQSSSRVGNLAGDGRSRQFDLPRLPGSDLVRPASASRALRRVEQAPTSRSENTRFNLQHLLSNNAGRTSEQHNQRDRLAKQRLQPSKDRVRPVDPRSRNSRARDPRAHDQRRSQISLQPLKTPSSNLPSIRPVTQLHPTVRNSKTGLARRRGADASFASGQVKRLNVHPIAPVAPPTARHGQRRSSRPPSPVLYLTRLLILGVGVGAIMGTALSVWNPATKEGASSSQATSPSSLSSQANLGSMASVASVQAALQLTQAMAPLSRTIQDLTTQYPGLTPGVFVVDLDNGTYVDLNGNKIFSSASLIKVPILVAFLQDVDSGKIRLDELLTMRQVDIAGEAGDMQDMPPGSQFSALETATKMITISDNTATNMIINRLGGVDALNQRFRTWGMTETVLRSPLPDLSGNNTTSPKDLVNLLAAVSQGDLLSLRSRDRLLNIMRNTVAGTLLPSGLGPEAIIAHKTGTINSILGDTGLVDMPSGKRYIVTVIVQRPADDERAREFIQSISRQIYDYLSQPPSSYSPGRSPYSTGAPLPSTALPSVQQTTPSTSPSSSSSPYSSQTEENSSAEGRNFGSSTSPAMGSQ
jgi:beta-lactamase class A